MIIFVYNLSKDIRYLIRLKASKEIELPKIEHKPEKGANRRPRTQEEKDNASKKKKEWWNKKRQEEDNLPPDAGNSNQV